MSILYIRDESTNQFVEIPALRGRDGVDGKDAVLTKESISEAIGYTPANQEDCNDLANHMPIVENSQVTYKVLTADDELELKDIKENIAQIDENLNSLNEDKADKPKPYELIETINITEPVEAIVRTGLNLPKIYVRIVAPAAGAAKYIDVLINSSKGRSIGYFYVNVAQTYKVYTYFSTEVEDGIIVGENCATKYGEHYESSVKRYRMSANDGELIDRMDICGASNIPIGTTIKIWGVKANA